VRFYEDDDELGSAVGEFLAAGLRAGGAVIVVADPPHTALIEGAVAAAGIDVGQARSDGRYVGFDARHVLSTFMVGTEPDPALFFSVIGPILDQAAAGGREVRVYGEMVAELWADGNPSGAVTLEMLWNDLAATRPFSLYCAYPLAALSDCSDLTAAKGVCNHHSMVMTPPSYLLGSPSPGRPPVGAERARFFLPVPLAAHAVRRFVAETLESWRRPDLVDDAELVITELVSNAYLHACSPFRVVLSVRDGALRLSVHDGSHLAPVRNEASADAPGGRGIGIVATLAQVWGIDPTPDGKVVWAELAAS
jgi:anti-sigma regulatory factor (Ser/Thr protein kinase)